MIPTDPIEYALSLERLGMKFGLEKIAALCTALGRPEHAFQSVLVAGTNGKGSVTAMVERGLRAAGHRSARYTSPHLTRLEERFVVDGREVSAGALRNAAALVQRIVHALLEEGVIDGPPTFFEFITAVAFVLFRDAGVEIAVLEVGLGGRLDATNIVSPLAAAITSIDFDHQAQLGATIASIAREKAGIIKPGIPVVCGAVPPAAEEVIRAVCDRVGADLTVVSGDLPEEFADVDLALRGAHQRANAAIAIAVLWTLVSRGVPVDAAAMRLALTDVEWPGRLEEFRYAGVRVLLDAAHNPAGASALARYLRDNGWIGCTLVFGAMQDKDAAGMLRALLPVCGSVICTTAPTPRATAGDDLAAIAQGLPEKTEVHAVADPSAALATACTLRSCVVVAGSIFLIGPLRDILRKSWRGSASRDGIV